MNRITSVLCRYHSANRYDLFVVLQNSVNRYDLFRGTQNILDLAVVLQVHVEVLRIVMHSRNPGIESVLVNKPA